MAHDSHYIPDMRLHPDDSYRDYDWLYEHYVNQQLSTTDIAGLVGCSRSVIVRWLDKLGVPTRSKSEAIALAKEQQRELTGDPNAPKHRPWPEACLPPTADIVNVHRYKNHIDGKCGSCSEYDYCHQLMIEDSPVPYPCMAAVFSDIEAMWNEDPMLLVEFIKRRYGDDKSS
jgi:hypothetical protein